MTLRKKSGFKNFALILAVSDWNFQAITLVLCKSLLMTFFLYLNYIFISRI